MTTASWTYTYENDSGPSGSSSSDRTNWTKIVAPDGHYTYSHAWVSEPLAGKLVKKETRSSASSAVLRAETYTYLRENPVGHSYVLTYPGPGDLERPVHTTKVITTQSGDTFTSEYGFNTNHSSASYSYSTPISKSVKSNVSTIARVTTTQFGHNKPKWILNLPVKQIVNGRTTVENVFDGNGRKTSEKRNGAAFATYGYHSIGAFAWAKDANNRIIRADFYKRGTPEKVTRGDGKFVYQYVDDFGRISSMKDARGNTTSFSRDSMGRLLVVNPPDSWNNTYHSYSFNGSPSHTIEHGSAEKTITYDETFRPVLVETRDLITNISTFVNYDYDAAGRQIFSSFPSTSSSTTAGTATEYEGLGRVTKNRETLWPYASVTSTYHGSHRRTETDPEGNQTHYYSYGYDGPDGNDVRAIRSPLGKYTDIKKMSGVKLNIFANGVIKMVTT
jgi:YD repeat-containing protein